MGSLLGSGVMLAALGLREFDLVVSLRQARGEEGAGLGAAAEGVDADLAKKLIMLCCLLPEADPASFFCEDGVFAGVRAGTEDALLDIVMD